MLMIIGWAAAEYGFEARQALTATAAGLCAESALSGCLAALPTDTQGRDWLLSFLSSVKHVASIQTGALVNASSMSAADLIACDVSGLDEVIILQNDCDPAQAIAMARAYRQARPTATMGIRVWLEDAVQSGFQTQVARWKHGTEMLASVERSPFCADEIVKEGTAIAGNAQPLACEWLQSALTVTTSGVEVPCPAHIPIAGDAYPITSATELLERHGSLLRSAGSNPICSSCHRLARFVGADGLDAPALVRPFLPQYLAADPQYRDHVAWDLADLPAPEQESALASLLARIQGLSGVHP
jgi:hypothetical protein